MLEVDGLSFLNILMFFVITSTQSKLLLKAKEFKFLVVLFTRWTSGFVQRQCASCTGLLPGRGKLSWMAKLSIFQSIHIPTFTRGHELWVVNE